MVNLAVPYIKIMPYETAIRAEWMKIEESIITKLINTKNFNFP